jgi:hypothetical protein
MEFIMDEITQILISWFPLFLILLVVWILPIIIIAKSQNVGRQEKMAWILASLFISWVCLIVFLLIAPLKPADR